MTRRGDEDPLRTLATGFDVTSKNAGSPTGSPEPAGCDHQSISVQSIGVQSIDVTRGFGAHDARAGTTSICGCA